MKFNKPTRAWINAPSTHQQDHKHHGKVGIVWTDKDGFTNMYFATGPIWSMRVDANSLETLNSHKDIFRVNEVIKPQLEGGK
jgi:hypothetical protein